MSDGMNTELRSRKRLSSCQSTAVLTDLSPLPWLLFPIFVFLVGACGEQNPANSTTGGDFIGFLNKGAVVPHPIQTFVLMEPDSIRFSSSRDDSVIEAWSAELPPGAFAGLVRVVEENRLLEVADPVLPAGVVPCGGGAGMSIYFELSGVSDTLTIHGGIWCLSARHYWPPGLESLVDAADSLVSEYRPPSS